MEGTLTLLPDLAVPEAQILLQAQGSPIAALKLAAAFGYQLACRDMDGVCDHLQQPAEARR